MEPINPNPPNGEIFLLTADYRDFFFINRRHTQTFCQPTWLAKTCQSLRDKLKNHINPVDHV